MHGFCGSGIGEEGDGQSRRCRECCSKVCQEVNLPRSSESTPHPDKLSKQAKLEASRCDKAFTTWQSSRLATLEPFFPPGQACATVLTQEKAKKLVIAREYSGDERGFFVENGIRGFLTAGFELKLHELRGYRRPEKGIPNVPWKLSLEETPLPAALVDALVLLEAALAEPKQGSTKLTMPPTKQDSMTAPPPKALKPVP